MGINTHGAEAGASRVRLLPVSITLLLIVTVMLGLNFSSHNMESRPFFQSAGATETTPLSASDLDNVPVTDVGTENEAASLGGIGFRPNYSAELIEEEFDLDHVRCESCPYGHFRASKEIGPESPTYIGYHQDTEVRIRATFDDDFSVIKELVVVPPSNGISPADLVIAEDED